MNRRDFLNGTYSITLAAAALPLLKVMPAMASDNETSTAMGSTISEANDGSVRQRPEQSQESGANHRQDRRARQQSARTLQPDYQQPLDATGRKKSKRSISKVGRDARRVNQDTTETLRYQRRQK